MFVPLLEGFCLPGTLELYDRTIDPQEHLMMFNSLMLLSGGIDPIVCHAFPSTLKKSSILWFSTLKLGSINDFFELTTRFLTHFQPIFLGQFDAQGTHFPFFLERWKDKLAILGSNK